MKYDKEQLEICKSPNSMDSPLRSVFCHSNTSVLWLLK